MSTDLLSESEDENVTNLTVNRKFAKQFEETEKRKELERAKYLQLDQEDDDDDDDSEYDDEDEENDTKLDLQVVQIINKLRKKDPSIYEKSSVWFESSDSDNESSHNHDGNDSNKKHIKKHFKDIARDQILEDLNKDNNYEARDNDDDNDDDYKTKRNENNKLKKTLKLSYDDEQARIRQQIIQSTQNDTDNSDDEDNDDILKIKQKDPKVLEAEEIELQKALSEMKNLVNKNQSSEVIKDDFLSDYITKKKWMDKTTYKTYDDDNEDDDRSIDEEEKELDRVDRFESKYNFRFEELQQHNQDDDNEDIYNNYNATNNSSLYEVQGHSRQVQGSLRRVDDTRKIERENRIERKQREKRQKEAELIRLKNLKKQELVERLKKISHVAGN